MQLKTFSANERVITALDALAEKLERSRSDVIRRAIIHYAHDNGIEVPA